MIVSLLRLTLINGWFVNEKEIDGYPRHFMTLKDALTRVQDDYLRNAKSKSVTELIEAISQHNAHLTDVVSKSGLTREITR